MRPIKGLAALALALTVVAPSASAAPVLIGSGGEHPWVFVDRQGITHVAWDVTTNSQTQTFYRRALPGSSTFSPATTFSLPQDEDFAGVFITQDPSPSNRLVMVTERCCTTGVPATWAATSMDGGATWSQPAAVAQSGLSVNPGSGRVNLVADGPLGVWAVNGNPTFRLMKIPTALTPLVPDPLPEITSNPYDTQVAFDQAGQPVFAFGSLYNGYVRVGEAGTDQLVGTSATVSSIHLASGANGIVTLFYGGPIGGPTRIEARKLTGSTLGPAVTVASGSSNNFPYLGTDQAGGFHAVWQGDDGRVWWSRSTDGTSWSRGVAVTSGSGILPVVSAGADGKGWVVYQDQVNNARIFAAPLEVTDPSVPDTSGIPNPVVRRRGDQVYVTPKNPSLADLRARKCVNVRVQSARPAVIRVAIFSGRKSIRIFGATVVRFPTPGKKLVCVRVPLKAHTFDVRQPFRFAFAAKAGAHPTRNTPAVVTTTDFTDFK